MQAVPPNCFVLSVFDGEELSSFCVCSPTPDKKRKRPETFSNSLTSQSPRISQDVVASTRQTKIAKKCNTSRPNKTDNFLNLQNDVKNPLRCLPYVRSGKPTL